MKNYFVSVFTAGRYCLCHCACAGNIVHSLYMSVCGNQTVKIQYLIKLSYYCNLDTLLHFCMEAVKGC